MPGILQEQAAAPTPEQAAAPAPEQAATGGTTLAPGTSAPGGTPPTPEGDAPTPEEQKAYDQVLTAASTILYDEKTNGAIMEALEAGQSNPAKAVADVTVMLMQQIDQKSNGTIPEEIIVPAAAEVAELVSELGVSAGFFEYTEQDYVASMQQIMQVAADVYGIDPGMAQGVVPEEQQRIAQEQGAIAQQASQQGMNGNGQS